MPLYMDIEQVDIERRNVEREIRNALIREQEDQREEDLYRKDQVHQRVLFEAAQESLRNSENELNSKKVQKTTTADKRHEEIEFSPNWSSDNDLEPHFQDYKSIQEQLANVNLDAAYEHQKKTEKESFLPFVTTTQKNVVSSKYKGHHINESFFDPDFCKKKYEFIASKNYQGNRKNINVRYSYILASPHKRNKALRAHKIQHGWDSDAQIKWNNYVNEECLKKYGKSFTAMTQEQQQGVLDVGSTKHKSQKKRR